MILYPFRTDFGPLLSEFFGRLESHWHDLYTNLPHAYVHDRRDWYEPAGPVRVKCFETATAWLIECSDAKPETVTREYRRLAGNRSPISSTDR